MMKLKVMTALVAVCCVVSKTYAQPEIPKEQIPTNISSKVRHQIERLYSTSANERRLAMTELGKMGTSASEAIPFAVEMLADTGSYIGNETTKCLGKIGKPAVEPVISVLASEADVRTKCKAATTLGYLKDERAVKPLVEAALDDSNRGAGFLYAAAVALTEVNSPRTTEMLIAALAENRLLVRNNAAYILSHTKDTKAVDSLMKALQDETQKTRNIGAFEFGEITDYNRVRCSVISALGEMQSIRALPSLIQILTRDKDPRIRERAARALGAIGNKRAVDILIHSMGDNDVRVRRSVARALGQLQDPKAIDAVVGALKDRDREIRLHVVTALGEIANPRAVIPLTKVLSDPNKRMRRKAVWGLGQIKDRDAIPALIGMLGDTDGVTRNNASDALAEIGRPALSKLIDVLDDKNWHVRLFACKALGTIGDPRATERLIRLTRDKEFRVRKYAVEALGKINDHKAIGALIPALQDNKSFVRRHAAIALGQIGDASVVKPLVSAALRETDYSTRESIAKSLKMSRAPGATKLLVDALQNRENDPKTRANAAHTLGFLEDSNTREVLLSVLRDNTDDPVVRQNATISLYRSDDPHVLDCLMEHLVTVLDGDDPTSAYVAIRLIAKDKTKLEKDRAVEPLIRMMKKHVGSEYVLHALVSITGHNFGTDANKWQAWWTKQEKGSPMEKGSGRLIRH